MSFFQYSYKVSGRNTWSVRSIASFTKISQDKFHNVSIKLVTKNDFYKELQVSYFLQEVARILKDVIFLPSMAVLQLFRNNLLHSEIVYKRDVRIHLNDSVE